MQYTGSLQETNDYMEDGDMSQYRQSLVFTYVYLWTVMQVNAQTGDCWRESTNIYTFSEQVQRIVFCTKQQQLHVPMNIRILIEINNINQLDATITVY